MLVRCQDTNTPWLVDTGAVVSLIPAPPRDLSSHSSAVHLVAANGTRMETGSYQMRTPNLGGRRYPFTFLQANVSTGILGLDFIEHHRFAVLPFNRTITDTVHNNVVRAVMSNAAPSLFKIVHAPEYQELLNEFPALTKPDYTKKTVAHGVFTHINTNGYPVKERPRRLAPDKLNIAKAEFKKLQDDGIVRRSTSGWAAPLHMVPKADGSWRPCGDYRRLNAITEDDGYSIPNMRDFTRNLAGCTIFSKVDMAKGYHQIPVHPDDVAKTAVATPFGLFEYLRTPFGLKNATQTFQRLMDVVTEGLDDIFCYIDDIIIASKDLASHMAALRALFARLVEHGLVIQLEKCQFGQAKLQFLGHTVSASGIKPLQDRVEAIKESTPPSTVTEMQSFLGAYNFYHQFLPNAAQLLAPLHQSIAGRLGNEPVVWTEEMTRAFNAAKLALEQATELAHPDLNLPLTLRTDASDLAIGAVLEQLCDGKWRPISFFSRKLSPPERNYAAYDRELLGVFEAVKHFRHLLDGRTFDLFTDHKPLVDAIRKKGEIISARQQRQLSYLSEFNIRWHHIQGADNLVADFLSRPATDEPQPHPHPHPQPQPQPHPHPYPYPHPHPHHNHRLLQPGKT